MKQLIVLALFFTVAAAQLSCSSSFITEDGYSYNFYEGWFNVTDQYGVNWYFSVCATSVESPCGVDKNGEIVSVCQKIKDIPIPKGHADTVAVTQSPDGSSRGLELMYALESEIPVKTVIELVCSSADENEEYIKIKVIDNAMSVITYSSPKNCPTTIYDVVPSPVEPQPAHGVVIHSGAFIYFLFLCVSLVSVCCCCTCLLRRKRMQQRKDIQMKQFSSVAFQPIPNNTSAKNNATAQQAPSFNPYIAQPQFVYYYPSQNGAATETPFPQYTQNDVIQNDESIARNLQAQFDQESV